MDKDDDVVSESLLERARSSSLAFTNKHPIISSLIITVVAITTIPAIAVTGLVVLVIASGVGIVLLVLAPVTVVPVILMGVTVWAGYVASRWFLGLVFRGTVGSENRVTMRPEASALGNEAHGNLELNLVKVEQKEGGQPDQVS